MAKVLVVDDSADIRLLLSRTMKSAGYEVFQATDGSEVKAAVLSYQPDIVLLDVSMPKMDGFTALGQLKSDPRTKAIPVIMITAKGHPDDLETARSLGALDYINKPWGNGEVELRVQWALTALEQQRAARLRRKAAMETSDSEMDELERLAAAEEESNHRGKMAS
ncbi:MAG: response regulator [Chloroflexi bacterium]|nr:response regulator [Chloroflexota bacterium]